MKVSEMNREEKFTLSCVVGSALIFLIVPWLPACGEASATTPQFDIPQTIQTMPPMGIVLQRPETGAFLSEVTGCELTVSTTAEELHPKNCDAGSRMGDTGIHALKCGPSHANPDDDAECICIGDANVTMTGDDDECYPVGGCADAQEYSVNVAGRKVWAVRYGSNDVTLECILGTGNP
jgi:hypothetical protein